MREWKFNGVDFYSYPSYAGDDLGVVYTKTKTRIRIWAPTALEVELRIYAKSTGGEAIRIDQFQKADRGTWTIVLNGNVKGYYYTIRVNDGVWLNETPGIDARAVGTNGHRGLFFDPEDTNPEGWKDDQRVQLTNPVDAIIYELHIRDFSISPTSGMQNKGKYLAFTEHGTLSPKGRSTGIDHLKELGITHVHLLPVSDFSTVDENAPDKAYNWGYDPQNYNAPEGSYATDPKNISRIKELKMLIQALHTAGIGVILDVVYNHTVFTSRSYFNQTVPGYYYRQRADGSFSNASGCGNELASERYMVRKYILESLSYWATEFHLDGFRFDLMGILDLETMNMVRTKMDTISPSLLLYGEGWTADTSPLPDSLKAIKTNVSKLDRIAVFNDDFRDGIKGNTFVPRSKGFVSGQVVQEETIKFGITGACFHPQIVYGYVEHSKHPWATEPWQCINYVSCHDNYTLYDKLVLSSPEATEVEINRMTMMAGAMVLTSQGIPFLHAGQEMTRTKLGDHNSYKSPDLINQIDWNRKSTYVDIFKYYQDLITLRKNHPAFRMPHSEQIRQHLVFSNEYLPGVASYVLTNHANNDPWKTIQVIFNAKRHSIIFPLRDQVRWRLVAFENTIDENSTIYPEKKTIEVAAISMMILVEDDGHL
ncbi:MAG TPA: type I pullulanase [Prolixibacteraceae bacterium]|nr:type I pullulanase [Prolixibacteraceae bacterium]